MEPLTELCYLCKLKPVIKLDDLEQGYCEDCADESPIPTTFRALAFLAATIPFQVGDRVECRTGAAIYDGIGHVDAVHYDWEHLATPVNPMWHVVIDEKANEDSPDEALYSEICLTKVEDD